VKAHTSSGNVPLHKNLLPRKGCQRLAGWRRPMGRVFRDYLSWPFRPLALGVCGVRVVGRRSKRGRPEPTNYRPVKVRNRRIFPVPAGSGEGPFTEPTPAAQSRRREPLL